MNNKIILALRIKPFLYLWLAEVFSQIAFNMVNFILLLLVFKLTNSNIAVSGIVIAFIVPAIIFGLLAGAFVDRWNKKNVLFLTNASRAILLVFLAFFHNNLFILYPIAFISSVITQFFIPAETPIIPLLVKKNLLLSANALFGLGLYGSIFIAYLFSGPFLLIFGQQYIFIVLALFFFLASIFVSLIKIPKRIERKQLEQMSKMTLMADIKNAISLIAKTKKIYDSLFLLSLVQIIILILATIGPGYASQILNIKVDEFPLLIVSPMTLGMIAGAVLVGNFFVKYSKQSILTLGIFLGGITIFSLPYGSKVASKPFIYVLNTFLPNLLDINILHIVIFLAFILGFANALVFVPSNTVLQEETTDEFRGKVYGALNALVGILSLFPIVIVGELADLLGVGKVLTGLGVSLILIGAMRLTILKK